MSFHVGIYPSINYAFIFNTSNGNVNEVPIQWFPEQQSVYFPQINPIKRVFDTIKSHIDGIRGCVSVVLEKYDNATRKDFIQYGLETGFEKVEIIDAQSARYLHATFYSDYLPKNGDIIWIIHNGICHIWEKSLNKAKYIKSMNGDFCALEKYLCGESEDEKKAERSLCPNAILYDNNSGGLWKFNLPLYKYDTYQITTFSLTQIFKSAHNPLLTAKRGSLIHARLMANDADLIEYDIERMLDRQLTVRINNAKNGNQNETENKIIDFQDNEQLPLQCKIILKKKQEHTKIIIESTQLVPRQSYLFQPALMDRENLKNFSIKQKTEEKVPLPPCDNLILTLNIDKNGIHTINIEEMLLENFSNIDEFISAFYGTPNPKTSDEKDTKISASEIQRYSIPKKIFTNNLNVNAVGIDLGTTRCCAAVNRKNGFETVALENTGGRLLPSYVAFDEEHDKCGQIVIDRLRHSAKSSVFDIKRIIGRTLEDLRVDESWTFKVDENDGEVVIVTQNYKKEALMKKPEELSAVLLKYIKGKVEAFQGKILTNAVITVPAAFNTAQKIATEISAKLAGWQTIHLLPEPVAATFAYYINQPIPEECTLLLFDLGGGTLDVCIFKILKGELNIISRNGDPNLGGRDFDNILIDYFKYHLKTDFGIILNESKQYKLMQKCQEAKEALTAANDYSLDVEDFGNIEDKFIRITRDQFENLIEKLLEKLRKCITSTLEKAECTKKDMNKVLYVGGGCKMPKVKELLKEIFPHAEHCCEENPDEVVAVGAAYYAYYLNCDKKIICQNHEQVLFVAPSKSENQYCFPKKITFYNDEINVIGISLGTGNCYAAVNRKNGIQTVALDNIGQRLLAAYVAFDEKEPKCGQIVIDRLRNYSKSTAFDMQKLLGKNIEEIGDDKNWPFSTTTHNNRVVINLEECGKNTLKYAEEAMAVLIKHIKRLGEEYQGKLMNEAVIAIPSDFNETQKDAMRAAATLAGWKRIHFLEESIAATFGYFYDRNIPHNSTLFLFDLGDGKLDVSVLKIEKNQVQIIGSNTDPNIGGRDFDKLIYHYFKEKLTKNYKIEITESKKYKLMLKCKYIKENLSMLQKYFLEVDDIDVMHDEKIWITRNELEKISFYLLCKIRKTIYTVLNKLHSYKNQIDKILQVGGGCRMPVIKKLLFEIFPDSEHCYEEYSDEVVAVGAVYYAYHLKTAYKAQNRCSIN